MKLGEAEEDNQNRILESEEATEELAKKIPAAHNKPTLHVTLIRVEKLYD